MNDLVDSVITQKEECKVLFEKNILTAEEEKNIVLMREKLEPEKQLLFDARIAQFKRDGVSFQLCRIYFNWLKKHKPRDEHEPSEITCPKGHNNNRETQVFKLENPATPYAFYEDGICKASVIYTHYCNTCNIAFSGGKAYETKAMEYIEEYLREKIRAKKANREMNTYHIEQRAREWQEFRPERRLNDSVSDV